MFHVHGPLHTLGVGLALGLLCCGSATATNWYVAPDGSDKAAGSQERPWLTLHHAAGQAQPGDVVKVRAGVYRQTNIITACHGTAERPIAFEADGGPVILDGSELVADWKPEGGARYSAPFGTKTAYLVWTGDRVLLGPGYREVFRPITPTKDSLVRGQCLVDSGRIYVRMYDDSDPNRTEVRVSVGHSLLLQSTSHTVWRGIGTAWGLNGYKLEDGSRDNLFCNAELHHHSQGILEIGERAPRASCESNTFQRLHIHHVGPTKFEHGIYTDAIHTRVLQCCFDHITGAAIHAYPKPFEGEYDGNRITDPMPPYHVDNFKGDHPPEPTGCYTAIVCWGKGAHHVANNVISGPFGTGISVRSSGNSISGNKISLERGPAIRLEGKSKGNSIRNNTIQTAGYYLVGQEPEVLDGNVVSGGLGWSFDGKNYASLADLRKAGKEEHGSEAAPAGHAK